MKAAITTMTPMTPMTTPPDIMTNAMTAPPNVMTNAMPAPFNVMANAMPAPPNVITNAMTAPPNVKTNAMTAPPNVMTAPCSPLNIRPAQPRIRKVPGVLGSLVVGRPGVNLFDEHNNRSEVRSERWKRSDLQY
jgi:hypothetical protein